MIKTKNLIFLMAVIAMGVLFTAPAAMAVWPEPPPIYTDVPMTAQIAIKNGPTYNISVDVEHGLTCGTESCDEFQLHISSSTGTNGLNAVYITTPRWTDEGEGLPGDHAIYCSETLTILEVFPAWQRNQSTDVLYNLSGLDAMQWTNTENDSIWTVRVNKIDEADLVPGTVCVKDGRYYGCAAVAVFDCPRPDCEVPLLPSYISVPPFKIVQLAGVDYCVEIDRQTGCPDPINPKIYKCDTPSTVLTKDEDFRLGADGDEEQPLVIQSPNDNPNCPIVILGHNPCTWLSLGGVPFGPVCW